MSEEEDKVDKVAVMQLDVGAPGNKPNKEEERLVKISFLLCVNFLVNSYGVMGKLYFQTT